MSKLIDIIVEYNKLSQNDKELFKQVIDTPSEKSNEKRDCKCHDGSLPVRISCNGMRHGK